MIAFIIGLVFHLAFFLVVLAIVRNASRPAPRFPEILNPEDLREFTEPETTIRAKNKDVWKTTPAGIEYR